MTRDLHLHRQTTKMKIVLANDAEHEPVSRAIHANVVRRVASSLMATKRDVIDVRFLVQSAVWCPRLVGARLTPVQIMGEIMNDGAR